MYGILPDPLYFETFQKQLPVINKTETRNLRKVPNIFLLINKQQYK